MDSLGDRCKQYERNSERYFTRKVPIMIRVDGRAFHTFTKNCQKPFDDRLIHWMFESAVCTGMEMSGFAAVYVQSDEATFLLRDDATITTEHWFGGRQNKLESVTAALMTGYFNYIYTPDNVEVFDARAFQVPLDDVPNVFLWRMKDWHRNSLNMYASSFFTHKELHGKSNVDRHNMLHSVGKNWATDLSEQIKNGSWYIKGKRRFDILPHYEDIRNALELA